jgi:hypothetical protein
MLTPHAITLTDISDTHLFFYYTEEKEERACRIAIKHVKETITYDPYGDGDPTQELEKTLDFYDMEQAGMYIEILDVILDNKEHWRDDTFLFRTLCRNLRTY